MATLTLIALISLAALAATAWRMRARWRAPEARQERLLPAPHEIDLSQDRRDLLEALETEDAPALLWAPMAYHLLPGKPWEPGPGELRALGVRATPGTFLNRQGDRIWFLTPTPRKPGAWVGVFVPMEQALEPGVELESQGNTHWLEAGDLRLELAAPELIFPAMATSWWRPLDELDQVKPERRALLGFSHDGRLRVARAITARVRDHATTWIVSSYLAWMEREIARLDEISHALPGPSAPLEPDPDGCLSRLLEAAARRSWPRAEETTRLRQRVIAQREALCRAVLARARGAHEPSERAWSTFLQMCTHPEHTWCRRALLAEHERAPAELPEGARVALALALLEAGADAFDERVGELLERFEVDEHEDLMIGVLRGFEAGEPLIRHKLTEALTSWEPEPLWELVRPWIGQRPHEAWSSALRYLDEDDWAHIEAAAARGDPSASRALAHQVTEEAEILALAERLDGPGHAILIAELVATERPCPPALIAAQPLAPLRQSHTLARAWVEGVARTPNAELEAIAEDLERRATALLDELEDPTLINPLVHALGIVGQRAGLEALGRLEGRYDRDKKLARRITRAREHIQERVPALASGQLSLAEQGGLQGAITHAHAHGSLAIVEPTPPGEDPTS